MEMYSYRKSAAYEISLTPPRFHIMWRVIKIS